MGDFNARTGLLDDCIQLDGEINYVVPRANKDTKINTNGRLLIDLCKTTEIAILNGRIGEDKHVGAYTCVTHNGKSSIDYILAEHSCIDSILNLSVKNFDPCLSDVHCCLVLELEYRKLSPIAEPNPRKQVKRIWNGVKAVEFSKHLSTRDFSEIRNCFEVEPQTVTVVNAANALLAGILLDSAKSVGALKFKSKYVFEPRNKWSDVDCQKQRRIYRTKLREAKKKSNYLGK